MLNQSVVLISQKVENFHARLFSSHSIFIALVFVRHFSLARAFEWARALMTLHFALQKKDLQATSFESCPNIFVIYRRGNMGHFSCKIIHLKTSTRHFVSSILSTIHLNVCVVITVICVTFRIAHNNVDVFKMKLWSFKDCKFTPTQCHRCSFIANDDTFAVSILFLFSFHRSFQRLFISTIIETISLLNSMIFEVDAIFLSIFVSHTFDRHEFLFKYPIGFTFFTHR